MSEHVLDWLGAYHDGELEGPQLSRVDAHLRTCAFCQAELAALQGLSARLQASPPMPARTPPEQFVAQVGLRLPLRTAPTSGRARVRQAAGLWLPLVVVVVWAFCQAVLAVGAVIVWALGIGWTVWLQWLVLEIGVTAVAAVLTWGCLAGWWAARETNFAPTGVLAGG